MSRPQTFAQARVAELTSRLDGPTGQGCAAALGRLQDNEKGIAQDAVVLRYPPRTPDDALDILGANSGPITRFPNEPDGTVVPPSGYHGRLLARWATARKKGSAQGIIDSLHGYGITDVVVYQDFEDAYWIGDWYSRFGVRLGPNFGTYTWTAPMIDVDMIIDETVIETTATLAEIHAVKLQILTLKSAHSYPVEIIVDYGDGFSTTWKLGPLIDYDFIIDYSTIGGYLI